MLETILVGHFFFGNEPEQILFMLYTLVFIWGSTMRSFCHTPPVAPHVLDLVAAAGVAAEAASSSAPAEATTTTGLASVVPKSCGRTIGEIAATCGISIALSAYLDPQRIRFVDPQTKRWFRRTARHTVSYVLGVTVNFIADVQDWWEAKKKTLSNQQDAGATAEL